MDDLQQSRGIATRPVAFASSLRELRERRRLSQSRLAEAAGFEQPSLCRSARACGFRTRSADLKMSDGRQLVEHERAGFLAAAGFMPARIESLFAGEPVLSEVLGLLQDVQIPTEIRDDVRNMISLLVRQAQRAAAQLATGAPRAGSIAAD